MNIETSIKVLGPGTWYSIHFRAAHCDSPAKIKSFADDMVEWADAFICEKCGIHMATYIAANPIKAKTATDLLRWTYDLHNHANANSKVPKGNPSWEDVLAFYTPSGHAPCDAICNGIAEPPDHQMVLEFKDNQYGRTIVVESFWTKFK